MLKQLVRGITTATALLLTVAVSSALAAGAIDSAIAPAIGHASSHRAKHRKAAGRRGHRKTHKKAKVVHADVAALAVLLGQASVEPNHDSLLAGQAEVFRLQAGSSGIAGVAHFYIGTGNAAKTVLVGIYGSVEGQPGTLLSTGSASASGAGTWTAFPLTHVELLAGKTYWLAILGTGGTLDYRDRPGGPCPAETSAQITLSALPSSWKTYRVYNTCPVSAYVTAAEAPPGIEPVAPAPPLTPPVEEPQPAAPANTVLPLVSGSAVEGRTLSASTGTWTGSPTSYAYQWQDCNSAGASCVSVSGAISPSYKLAASDVGHTVRVAVTASDADGSTPASSGATATVGGAPPPAPTNTSLPVVSGTTTEGQTLSASTGTWTGSPTSYAYQWQDCNSAGEACAVIGGATSDTHELAPGDVGHTLRAVVTASNAGGSTTATSAATAPATVITVAGAPANTVLPAIGGSAVEGRTLTASTGTWTGAPTSYASQWEDCNSSGASCSNIGGATDSTYKLTSSDVGHTVRAVVTATNETGSTPASSAATVPVTTGGSCTATYGTSSSWSSVTSALAVAGSTVCLSEGAYPAEHIWDIAPSSNSTLTAAPGADVTIESLEIAGHTPETKNLSIENLHLGGEIIVKEYGSHLNFDHDEWDGVFAGVFLFSPKEEAPESYINIEYDRMEHLECGESIKASCSAPAAVCVTAQGTVTHVVYSHSVCGPYISGHYTQFGNPKYMSEEYDTFLGPSARYITGPSEDKEGQHQNLLQVFGGPVNEHITFSNNVIRNTGANGNAILFENTHYEGQTAKTEFVDTSVENNLFERDADGDGPSFCPQNGLTYKYNTEIASIPTSSFPATNFSLGGPMTENKGCGPADKYHIEHNLVVEIPCTHLVPGYFEDGIDKAGKACEGHAQTDLNYEGTGAGLTCESECTVEDNVTSDESADTGGSTHYERDWKPTGSQKWSELFTQTKEGPYGLESEKWTPTSASESKWGFAAGYKGGGGAPTNVGPQN
jgi:hypothetical protein